MEIADYNDVLLDMKDGKKIDWDGHKYANSHLVDSYRRLEHHKKAERCSFCGSLLVFKVYENGERKLHQAQFCRDRLCIMCAWRRSLKMFAQTSKIMTVFQHEGDYKFLFLSLTVRNCPAEKLHETIDMIFYGFKKFVLRKEIKKVCKGWFRALEVTHNWDTNEYHPHFHVVIAVDEVYNHYHPDYITHEEFKNIWKECCSLNYEPWVHIQTAKHKEGDYGKAVAEISKYTVKPSDYLGEGFSIKDKKDPIEANYGRIDEIVNTLIGGLKGRRLIAYGGRFKELHRQLNLDDALDGDLVVVDGDDIRPDLAYVLVKYGWQAGYKQYIKVEARTHDTDGGDPKGALRALGVASGRRRAHSIT